MKRKVLAFVLSLLLVVMNAPLALASGSDTTPPEVLSLQFNQTSYTVGDTMSITLHLGEMETDLQPNYNRSSIEFCNLDGSVCKFEWMITFSKVDSTTYVFSKTLTKDSGPSGTYKIFRVTLEDLSGNSSTTAGEALPEGTQTQFAFTNNVRTDWTPPVLDSVDISPDTVNVGGTVNAVVTAHDESGLDDFGSIIIGDAENHYFYFDLHTDPQNPGRLTGKSFPIPEDMPSGDYFVEALFLRDVEGNALNSGSCDGSLPASMCKKVTVVNDNAPVQYDQPVITSIDIATPTIKQGDPVDVTVTLDTKGNPLDHLNNVESNVVSPNRGGCGLSYTKISDGVFRSQSVFPVNLPTGDYFISNFVMYFMNDSGTGSGYDVSWPGHQQNGEFMDDTWQYSEKITVTSVFSGTDNVSVVKGSEFDPLAGVSASNNTEGDMTSKIEVEAPANFSTDTVGIYLFKYKIKSSQTFYGGPPLYYYDFRWVGVTDLMPGDADTGDTGTGGTPIVVTDGSVAIGADSSDASLKRNGSGIAFAGSVSAAGNYTITVNGGDSSSKGLCASIAPNSSSGGKCSASFVIDRSAPVLSPSYKAAWPDKIVVKPNAKDQSGTAKLKWMKGVHTLGQVRSGGTEFKGSFTVNAFGKYTIYAKDVFGYESVTVCNVIRVPVTSVRLNKSSVKLTAGCSVSLVATVRPGNATFRQVSWSSSNTAVATVDRNGKVRGVGPGTARITVRTLDGSKTRTCTVKVSKPVAVSSVTLNRTSRTMKIGQKYSLIATLHPSNAYDKTIVWSSTDTKVVRVDKNGLVQAVGKGKAYIYARAGNGKCARCLVTVQ